VHAASIERFGYSLTTLDTVPVPRPAPTTIATTDTFQIKRSKDTLEAPIKYQATDSAVVLVRQKKLILYGKTNTAYSDMTLAAPTVELDQQTKVVKAVRTVDSTGGTLEAAVFKTGETEMTNDTIFYNFRTQVGVTKKTYTKQGEMLVIGEQAKKVSPTTTFIKEARFTTCMLDEPHFAFVSGKMKMINQQLAVSGPAHPEFEGVPMPIYVPFGFYPLNQGRHSGLMRPNFMNDEQRGLGLQGMGYYKVINDYWDAQLTADLFSYGEWAASARTSYRRRYRYNGGFGLDFRSSKQNFKGDPDFNKTRVFNISWSHAVDGRCYIQCQCQCRLYKI
jgi:lipopolysaccharide assembly outer membrane protein LptD (OstA)